MENEEVAPRRRFISPALIRWGSFEELTKQSEESTFWHHPSHHKPPDCPPDFS